MFSYGFSMFSHGLILNLVEPSGVPRLSPGCPAWPGALARPPRAAHGEARGGARRTRAAQGANAQGGWRRPAEREAWGGREFRCRFMINYDIMISYCDIIEIMIYDL